MKNHLVTLLLLLFTVPTFSILSWTQKTSMPGLPRNAATGFTIGDDLYVGTGLNTGVCLGDFWKFDKQTGAWTQVSSIAGNRYGASGFSYNNKGYVTCGYLNSPVTFYNDMVEYDPIGNSWTAKTPLPGTTRYGSSSFVLDGVAYIVCGNFGSASGPLTNEVWAYNITNDSWTSKAPYPGGQLYYTTSFAINNFGYAGGGREKPNNGAYVMYDTFYKYDATLDSWSPIAPYPGGRHSGMAAVVYNQKVVVGGDGDSLGWTYREFHTYDPIADSWTAGPDLPVGYERSHPVGLNTPTDAYISSGIGNSIYFNDLWKLEETTSIENFSGDEKVSIFYFQNRIYISGITTANNRLELYNLGGKLVKLYPATNGEEILTVPTGIYLVRYFEANRNIATKKLVVGL